MTLGLDASDDRPDELPAGHRLRPFLIGSLFFRRSPGGVRIFAALIWLAFIVFPLIDAIGKHEPVVRHGLVIGGAALFVAAYVGMVMTWRGQHRTRLPLALFGVLLAMAVTLTLSQASSWGFLFTYCAACAALVAPEGVGFYAVALCSVLAGVTSAIAGADGGTVVSYVASSAGIGLLMLVMSDLRLRNQQLSQARAELAQMAVAQERERFARDLHDLLGHSLSVIALKAELAGRMLTSRPDDHAAEARVLDQAATEVRELERVARTALGEVRDAVSGYRQPTLDGELAGARMALAAAGIEADVQQARVPLDPAVEAVLAWAVREGATNVIRHSRAHHCTLRVTASLTDAGVEVIDDGLGEAAHAQGGGTGHATGAGVGDVAHGKGGGIGHAELAAHAERAATARDTRADTARDTRADTARDTRADTARDTRAASAVGATGAVTRARRDAGAGTVTTGAERDVDARTEGREVGARTAGPDVGGRGAGHDVGGRGAGGADSADVRRRNGVGGVHDHGDAGSDLGSVGDLRGGVGGDLGRVGDHPGSVGDLHGGFGTHPGRGGHGLAGLAERAGLLNGTIEAGPLASGGYRLAVNVPVAPT